MSIILPTFSGVTTQRNGPRRSTTGSAGDGAFLHKLEGLVERIIGLSAFSCGLFHFEPLGFEDQLAAFEVHQHAGVVRYFAFKNLT